MRRLSRGGTFSAWCGLTLCMAAAAAGAQDFQWPEEPENLQVLPADAKGLKLGQIMRGFTIALGVRCDHCHVGDGTDLTQYDFAADDKPAKLKARIMIEMLAALNRDFLPQLSAVDEQQSAPLTVMCITCHRKSPRPVMLEDVLTDAIHEGGFAAAEVRYRDLRDQHYGGFTFDFSAGALTRLGEQMARERDFETAIRLAELDIDANGESYSLYWSLGNIQERANRLPDAIESYRKGLALAPEEWQTFFDGKLQKLGATESPSRPPK